MKASFALKNTVLLFASLFFILCVLEVVARLYPLHKTPFSYPHTDFAQTTTEGLLPQCHFISSITLDPYLGFVFREDGPCGVQDVGNQGFYGNSFSQSKDDNVFTIMLTGGSVASLLGRETFLEDVLNEHYFSPNKKPFKIINAAISSWKYPQQFIAFALYHQLIDAVVTLDGYNEFWIIRSGYGQLEIPFPEQTLLWDLQSELSRKIFLRLHATLIRWQLKPGLLRRSHLLFYLSSLSQDFAYKQSVTHSRRFEEKNVLSRYGFFDLSHDEKWAINIKKYASYLDMIDTLSKKFNIKNAHFLQPIPSRYKTLSENEKSLVSLIDGALAWGPLYEKMITELHVHGQKLPLIDLADIFQFETQEIYVDHIHPNRQGLKIMSMKMAHELAKLWKLPKR